jgi:hypothetical protein
MEDPRPLPIGHGRPKLDSGSQCKPAENASLSRAFALFRAILIDSVLIHIIITNTTIMPPKRTRNESDDDESDPPSTSESDDEPSGSDFEPSESDDGPSASDDDDDHDDEDDEDDDVSAGEDGDGDDPPSSDVDEDDIVKSDEDDMEEDEDVETVLHAEDVEFVPKERIHPVAFTAEDFAELSHLLGEDGDIPTFETVLKWFCDKVRFWKFKKILNAQITIRKEVEQLLGRTRTPNEVKRLIAMECDFDKRGDTRRFPIKIFKLLEKEAPAWLADFKTR